jgi:lipoyl(octanoyl) transferase
MPRRAARPPVILKRPDDRAADWAVSPGRTPYLEAVAFMERRAQAIAAGEGDELIWLVEHPPLYSAGVSAKPTDLLQPDRFPVFAAGRGGQFTYHGPGQRVVYVMLDLRARGQDVRAFVSGLEAWVISTITDFGLTGETRPDRVGVWVPAGGGPGREAKIAAIGVKIRRWVSFHGLSLNVAPDLEHFGGIVPCGLADHGVTSLAALGFRGSMADVDETLRQRFEPIFGPIRAAPAPALE